MTADKLTELAMIRVGQSTSLCPTLFNDEPQVGEFVIIQRRFLR
jgi:hypothetical protein